MNAWLDAPADYRVAGVGRRTVVFELACIAAVIALMGVWLAWGPS